MVRLYLQKLTQHVYLCAEDRLTAVIKHLPAGVLNSAFSPLLPEGECLPGEGKASNVFLLSAARTDVAAFTCCLCQLAKCGDPARPGVGG